jgi:hypothetical protein
VKQPEIHDDRVKAVRLEWQPLGIPFEEFDVRNTTFGFVDHQGRKVDADDNGASDSRRRGGIARPRRDVEHTGARCDTDRIQQRLDRLRREGSEGV